MTRCPCKLLLVILASLLFLAGCERGDTSPFTAEVDEPGYRRGKELLRQGRNQEALSEFQKVIEKRGLNNAPEAHLELGLLYHQHIKDPIAAIYHYRRFRELKPNSPQADLVRQNIDAATREFARTLPGQPLENQLNRMDLSDVVQRLQRENEQLKSELARARGANLTNIKAPPETAIAGEQPPADDNATALVPIRPPTYTPSTEGSPVSGVPAEPEPRPALPIKIAPTLAPVARVNAPATVNPANNRPAASSTGRRHSVAKGDTLSNLSQRYYGTRSRWRDIYSANRDVMRSEGDLRIGMEIKIPQ